MFLKNAHSPLEGRLLSLQVLRAIAALMVAVAHLYSLDQRFFGGPVLPAFVRFGFSGVDLFFVLSGFVMVYLTRLHVGNASIVPVFLFSRVARIYPLWWLALGAISTVWLFRPTWVFSSISGAPNLLADFALWPHDRLPLLAVGWTLIHEMYFYLAFAFVLLLPARHFFVALSAWLVVVVAANLLLTSAGVLASPSIVLVTHPLTIEFGLGSLVGLLSIRGFRPAPRLLIAAGMFWFFFVCLLKWDDPLGLFESSWNRVAAFGPAWALLVWGAVGLEANEKIVPFKRLTIIGDASYALYLVHVPVLASLARLIAPWCGPSAWNNIAAWVFLLSAVVATALLSHKYVERPMLAFLAKTRAKVFPGSSKLLSDSRTR